MRHLWNLSPPVSTALFTLTGLFLPFWLQVLNAAVLWAVFIPFLRIGRRMIICLSVSSVLFFSVGMRRQFWAPWLGLEPADVIQLQGVAKEDSRRVGQGSMVLVDLHWVQNKQGVMTSARESLPLYIRDSREIAVGSTITATGVLSDRAGNLAFQADAVIVQGFSHAIWRFRAEIRTWLMQRLQYLYQEEQALLYALLIGNRQYIDPLLLHLFRDSGNMHVLALSGMHLTLLAVVLMYLLRGSLRFSLITTTILLGAYVLVAGFFPSLIRAYLMFFAYAFLRMSSIPVRISTVIAISFLLMLLAMPSLVFSLSYQLSMVALSGIIIIGTRLSGRLRGYIPRFLREPWAASIGAVIFSSPLTLSTFGKIYPFSFLFSPLVALGIAIIFLLGLMQLVLPLPLLFPSLIHGIYVGLVVIVAQAADLPSISVQNLPAMLLLPLVISGITIFLWIDR